MRNALCVILMLLLGCDHFPEVRSTVGVVTALTREPSEPTRPKNVVRPCTRPASELAYVVYANIYLADWTGWVMIETDPIVGMMCADESQRRSLVADQAEFLSTRVATVCGGLSTRLSVWKHQMRQQETAS